METLSLVTVAVILFGILADRLTHITRAILDLRAEVSRVGNILDRLKNLDT